MKTVSNPVITDEQSLDGATSRFGHPIKTYDDGYGGLFVMRDSMGIVGIVRAQTWEDAYSICEDEFFPEADDTIEDFEREYSVIYKSGRELWLHKNNNDWNRWTNLTHEQQEEELRRKGEKVPFTGEFSEHPYWQEAFGFRPNGASKKDKQGHGIYAKDLNGESLDSLTPELIEKLEITLQISENE